MNAQLSNKGKELIKIAVPAILESMVMVIVTAIDTKMVSVLGKPTVSAISLTSQPKLIIMTIFFALGTALSFFVAQAYGRQDKEEANKYFHSILKIGAVLSVFFGILTEVSAVQPQNVIVPMDVRLSGNVTAMSDSHPKNAESQIFVTPSGMMYSCCGLLIGYWSSSDIALSNRTPSALA